MHVGKHHLIDVSHNLLLIRISAALQVLKCWLYLVSYLVSSPVWMSWNTRFSHRIALCEPVPLFLSLFVLTGWPWSICCCSYSFVRGRIFVLQPFVFSFFVSACGDACGRMLWLAWLASTYLQRDSLWLLTLVAVFVSGSSPPPNGSHSNHIHHFQHISFSSRHELYLPRCASFLRARSRSRVQTLRILGIFGERRTWALSTFVFLAAHFCLAWVVWTWTTSVKLLWFFLDGLFYRIVEYSLYFPLTAFFASQEAWAWHLLQNSSSRLVTLSWWRC